MVKEQREFISVIFSDLLNEEVKKQIDRDGIRVKPSKGQSLAGFFGGLLFVGIGLFVAIPTFGVFGIIWTLFAVIITVTNGVNAFGEKGIASQEIEISDTTSNFQESRELDFEEKLRKLKALKDDGIITEDEYEAKKDEILNERW